MKRRSCRFRILLVALVAAFAAVAPAPARAMHASDPCPFDPGSLELACGTGFSLGVALGGVTGAGTELAYDYPLGRKTTLSELKWDLKSVAVAGAQASAGFGRRFRLNLGYWWAIDEGNGEMVDRDWLYSPAVSAILVPTGDNWTDESRHPDTTVDAGTMIDVNLTALALQSGPFSLRGIVGLKSDTWRWSARGGTYVYSSSDFRDTEGSFDSGEEVITYKQQFTIPYLGLGTSWKTPTLSVDAHALLSFAVSATDSDYHVLRDTLFEGDFARGTFLGLGLNATWSFAQHWSVTLGLEYQSIAEITGDVTITAPFAQGVSEVGGGIAMHSAMVTLGTGYRF